MRLVFLLSSAIGIVLFLAGCENQQQVAAVVKTANSLYTFDPQQAVHQNFSGQKALEMVRAQVEIGPRPSGSEGAEKCRQFLEKTLQGLGWEVQRQSFSDYTPKGNIQFHNVRARFPISGSETWKRNAAVLLASHYDTKQFSFPFVGANDAGSSTGAVLEMARVLSARPALAQFVELVFFDGEEAVVEYTMGGQLPTDGLYGSRHYVQEVKKQPKEMWPVAMVLLDMVGEKDVRIKMPSNCHPALVGGILAASRELKVETHFGSSLTAIVDDHLPFFLAGIPCVDVIDIDYTPWHTAGDTMEMLSAESLEIVGKTTLLALEKTFLTIPKWE